MTARALAIALSVGFATGTAGAADVAVEQAGLKSVRLPSTLEVGADYGMAVARSAEAAARDFARFVLGAEGQSRLRGYGFDPP